MTPKDVLTNAVDPALALLERLASIKRDPRARLLVMAIAGQESRWAARVQDGGGPAHSFWQFEQGGGVWGVLSHPSTRDRIKAVCAALGVECTTGAVYAAMAKPDHDVLSACMARLLLWTDAAALPAIGDVSGSWQYYLRNWRPGLPHPEVWPARYGTAMGLVNATPVAA